MAVQKKTLVIGASENPSRYSWLAVDHLRSKGHPVVAIGRRQGKIGDVIVGTARQDFDAVDTVTLYLSPHLQKEYYDYILSLHPRRLIFNPGTENNELAQLAEANGIEAMEACTLVLLSTGQF